MRYAVLVTVREDQELPIDISKLSQRYAQGPAGSGKSTMASAMMLHAQAAGRSMHLFNLDPAAEKFQLIDGTAITPSIDIRDLISLEEVMEDLGLGPNGGLVYCFEYVDDKLLQQCQLWTYRFARCFTDTFCRT